jgi:hypothetical protein
MNVMPPPHPQPPGADPALDRPHVAVAPSLLGQDPVVVRADDDTDADYTARVRLLAEARRQSRVLASRAADPDSDEAEAMRWIEDVADTDRWVA